MAKLKELRILYAFNFLKSLQFFGALAVPFYLYRAGLNYKGMFILETIFSVFIILFEIPTGVIADKFGRKISLFFGALGFAAGFFIFGFSTWYPLLVLAEIICALGMSLLSGADRAILYEILISSGREKEITSVNARYDAFGTAGLLIAFPLGTLFAGSSLVPYRTALGLVFVATAIMIVLSGIIVLFINEPKRVPSSGSFLRAGLDGFKFIFSKPALTRFSLNYAVISSLTFFMFWFYQSLLMKNNFPVSFQGIIAALCNLGAMILLLTTGFIQKKIGTKNALFLSSFIPALLYLGVYFIPGLPMALLAIFGVIILKLFRSPMLTSLMNTHIESSNRATVLSGVSMLERIITAILYPLAGILTDISLNWTFLVMGLVTLAASLFLRVGRDQFTIDIRAK